MGLVRRLAQHNVLYCLNNEARIGRLYWLTKKGCELQNNLRTAAQLPLYDQILPAFNWSLYGQLCFTHRTAVIKALSHPLQPPEIKRKLRIEQPHIQINADNVRDIIRFFKARGIVEPVYRRKKVYPQYVLTDFGTKCRELLVRAEVKIGNGT